MEGGSSTNVQRPHDSLRGSPSNTQGPVSNSRYPLRMPNRLGCSMLGCSVSKPDSESSYCCDSHREMAASMDSSALGVPCIIFDGLKIFDVALCSSLLHRTIDGIAVGIPKISNDIFSVPPWELDAEFHTQFFPAEGCRDLVFFVKDPPEKYPVMGETSCSWEQRSYHKIELNEDRVTLSFCLSLLFEGQLDICPRGVRI